MSTALSRRLDAALAPMAAADRPGFAIAVDRQGDRLYEIAAGLASYEAGTPFEIGTVSRIGSTTKQFACAAVLILERCGLLDRHDSARNHLPELTGLPPSITLHQLMTSSSGLRDPLDLSLIANGLSPVPDGELRHLLQAQQETNFGPGERFLYCNGGFSLLGTIVERVSGRSFAAFVAEELLEPAGMAATRLHASDHDMLPGLAAAHVARADGGFTRGLFPAPLGAEGGLVSTVGDLLAWTRHLLRPDNGWLLAAMTERSAYTTGALADYGLGLILDCYRGARRIHHPGGVIGASAQLLVLPDHALSVAVLSNSSGLIASEIADKLVDIVLEDQLEQAPAAHAPGENEPSLDGVYHHRASNRLLAIGSDEAGAFIDHLVARVPIVRDGNRLLAARPGMAPLELTVPNASSSSPVLIVRDCGHEETFERIVPPAAPLPPLGAFRSDDAGADAAIVSADAEGTLLVQGRHGRVSYALEPVGPRLWRARATGLPVWASIHATEDGFTLTTPRNWQVRFERVANA